MLENSLPCHLKSQQEVIWHSQIKIIWVVTYKETKITKIGAEQSGNRLGTVNHPYTQRSKCKGKSAELSQ